MPFHFSAWIIQNIVKFIFRLRFIVGMDCGYFHRHFYRPFLSKTAHINQSAQIPKTPKTTYIIHFKPAQIFTNPYFGFLNRRPGVRIPSGAPQPQAHHGLRL
jgi:hypothetical protein